MLELAFEQLKDLIKRLFCDHSVVMNGIEMKNRIFVRSAEQRLEGVEV